MTYEKELLGDTPYELYESVKKLSKCQGELGIALYLMRSLLNEDDPDMMPLRREQMREFIDRFELEVK